MVKLAQLSFILVAAVAAISCGSHEEQNACGADTSPQCNDIRELLQARIEDESLHATLTKIRCQNRACAIDVTWSSYVTALDEYPRFIEGTTCEAAVTLPPPGENVHEPVSATINWNCAEGGITGVTAG